MPRLEITFARGCSSNLPIALIALPVIKIYIISRKAMVAAELRQHHVLVLVILILHQEQVYNSTANLSTSWINHPSVFVDSYPYTDIYNYNITLTPILFRKSSPYYFVCGFYCNTSNSNRLDLPRDSGDCVFGVLIFQNWFGGLLPEVTLKSPELVWSLNRNNPVRIGAELQLRGDGNLVLVNPDGTLVWSSNTTGKSVAGLNLTENGNLVLFGRNGQPVWQSFDYPTDTLLPGQKLSRGQRLTASVSASNWSEGLFYLSVDDAGLEGYIKSNPPQRYYFSSISFDPSYVQFTNGSFHGYVFPPILSAQFIKFGPDGHLKVFNWTEDDWVEVADLLRGDLGYCGYPMACGNYGICVGKLAQRK